MKPTLLDRVVAFVAQQHPTLVTANEAQRALGYSASMSLVALARSGRLDRGRKRDKRGKLVWHYTLREKKP